jgi:hypothetical protein
MANRLIERDEEFNAHFIVNFGNEIQPALFPEKEGRVEPPIVAIVCKTCQKGWDVLLAGDGGIPTGPRNSLLAHAAVHSPKYRPPFKARTR